MTSIREEKGVAGTPDIELKPSSTLGFQLQRCHSQGTRCSGKASLSDTVLPYFQNRMLMHIPTEGQHRFAVIAPSLRSCVTHLCHLSLCLWNHLGVH